MTTKEKNAYIERIITRFAGTSDPASLQIFKATRAAIAAAIPGSQRKKHSAKMLDQMYHEAFPSILRAIR